MEYPEDSLRFIVLEHALRPSAQTIAGEEAIRFIPAADLPLERARLAAEKKKQNQQKESKGEETVENTKRNFTYVEPWSSTLYDHVTQEEQRKKVEAEEAAAREQAEARDRFINAPKGTFFTLRAAHRRGASSVFGSQHVPSGATQAVTPVSSSSSSSSPSSSPSPSSPSASASSETAAEPSTTPSSSPSSQSPPSSTPITEPAKAPTVTSEQAPEENDADAETDIRTD